MSDRRMPERPVNATSDAAETSVGVASPCIGTCALDADDLCMGCLRTLDEIAEWGDATDARKRLIHAAIDARRIQRLDAGND